MNMKDLAQVILSESQGVRAMTIDVDCGGTLIPPELAAPLIRMMDRLDRKQKLWNALDGKVVPAWWDVPGTILFWVWPKYRFWWYVRAVRRAGRTKGVRYWQKTAGASLTGIGSGTASPQAPGRAG